jgi:ferrous iron transport protein B
LEIQTAVKLLFNQLTGTRQKVANYAGVTVERKIGFFELPSKRTVRVLICRVPIV